MRERESVRVLKLKLKGGTSTVLRRAMSKTREGAIQVGKRGEEGVTGKMCGGTDGQV